MSSSTDDKSKRDGGVPLSASFDKVYEEYRELMNPEDSTSSSVYQARVSKCITHLEELTREVSAVDMFTKNENYEGLPPEELKFLLLPYLLGNLWTLRMGEERSTTLIVSQTYFDDFLERCTNYEFIERKEEVEDVDEDKEDDSKEKKKKKVLSPTERRDEKIKRLKRSQELDRKIAAYRERIQTTNEEVDDYIVRELFVCLIRRSISDAEDQLESIAMELELIKFGSSIPNELAQEGPGSSGSGRPNLPREKSKPLKPFIITKDATQKKVFGVGYPSLPVMTVEELYEQRRAQGQWAPPPANGAIQNPEVNQEEAEAVARERLEEGDDEGNIERQRAMDEYKDDHRRGWGNRFNRS